ncbi:MAG: type IVB secretion system protein IcmH/DotU, partial [Pseudomonadota bacterium]
LHFPPSALRDKAKTASAPPSTSASVKAQPSALSLGQENSINPVLSAANPLLDLILPLRRTPTYHSLSELRQQLVQAIKNFEDELTQRRLDATMIFPARYVLCTFLDETVASMPWGAAWASQSLLVAFHNEASGGEKVFLILQTLSQNPRTNLYVLELIYVCLALGFQGRYRVRERGREELEVLRERLREMIRGQRGSSHFELSPHWQAATQTQAKVLRLIPLWVIAAGLAAVLVLMHLFLSYKLDQQSAPVLAELKTILPDPNRQSKALPAVAKYPRLSILLATDIKEGRLEVSESADEAKITLHGDGLFASSRTEVLPNYEALLGRIADALKQVPGQILVVGHTDNRRSVSTGLSNLQLSSARAQAVVQFLAKRTGSANRYASLGRGASEPLFANDTPINQARNRRVEIVLSTPPASAPN